MNAIDKIAAPLEDKQRCPKCGHDLHKRSYLMARAAAENVLSWDFIAWVVVAVMVALVLVQLAPPQ